MVAAESRREARLTIGQFMTGLACVESSGRYEARNMRSGAYGKYQIMPRNWPAWAARYMNDRWALPTPRNQEWVARGRIQELYDLRQSWRRVAYWWLTGDGEPDERLWTTHAFKYVEKVMGVALRAASPGGDPVPERCFPGDFAPPRIHDGPRERVRVTGGRIHLRAAAGYRNRAVAYVTRGTTLTILGKGRDHAQQLWLRVGIFDGRTGWVANWLTDY